MEKNQETFRGKILKMKIIDNFLDKEDLEDLKNIVLGENFPWYMNDGVTWPGDGHIQFTHQTFKNGEFKSSFTLGGLDIFKEKLGFTKILRAKFNLLQMTPEIVEHPYHTDLPDPGKNVKTAILYLNTNNGYTKFKTGEQVESVENRLVLFDANVQHAGTTCTDKKYRAVFNLNFEANNENN